MSSQQAFRQLTQEECEKIDQGLGTLGLLPREIRIMIYKHMIAQGSVNIMRASSLIKADVSAIDIFEHGICRLNLNFYDMATEELKPCFNPSNFIVDKIINVTIRVDTRFNGSASLATPEVDILNKFSGANVHRKTCVLTFECWPMTSGKHQGDVLITVRGYTGFEKVKVAIEYPDWSGREWPQNHADWSLEHFVEFDSLMEAHSAFRKALTSGLGKSELGLCHKSPIPALVFRLRG